MNFNRLKKMYFNRSIQRFFIALLIIPSSTFLM
jgi:hypothetical protein